jgi:hypothetical protein
LGRSIGLIAALGAGFLLGRVVHQQPAPQSARNPLSVNGLAPLGRISSASDQASSASVQAWSSTDKASGRPFGASSVTDRASFVASEPLWHPFGSRSASDQASTASDQASTGSVEAPSASVQARRVAAGAPIHAPQRLCPCPQVLNRPPPVTAAIPGSAPGESDRVKRAP